MNEPFDPSILKSLKIEPNEDFYSKMQDAPWQKSIDSPTQSHSLKKNTATHLLPQHDPFPWNRQKNMGGEMWQRLLQRFWQQGLHLIWKPQLRWMTISATVLVIVGCGIMVQRSLFIQTKNTIEITQLGEISKAELRQIEEKILHGVQRIKVGDRQQAEAFGQFKILAPPSQLDHWKIELSCETCMGIQKKKEDWWTGLTAPNTANLAYVLKDTSAPNAKNATLNLALHQIENKLSDPIYQHEIGESGCIEQVEINGAIGYFVKGMWEEQIKTPQKITKQWNSEKNFATLKWQRPDPNGKTIWTHELKLYTLDSESTPELLSKNLAIRLAKSLK